MHLLLLLGTLAIAELTAQVDPRADVQEIAGVIERSYFDAQRAAAIASDLRNDASRGVFDRFADRTDLANALTLRLRKLDGHFTVEWNPDESKQQPTSTPGSPLPAGRTNFGFRRAERLPGNLGYLDLTYAADIDFSDTDSPARHAADAALAMMRTADAVILDLRDNGGGAPSMVGYLVSAFVDPSANVYNTFHSREGTVSERPSVEHPSPMLSVPLYVLTSGRTGSAAESIAFTLQSAKRAQVVGERSGGAANPGRRFNTPQGYAVFVSTGSPRNPINGRNWEREGVTPDVEAVSERALLRAQELALEKVLAGSIAGAARTDAQWTLDALRASTGTELSTPFKAVAGTFGPYTLESHAGTVRAKRARWPPMTLLPLKRDLFYFADNPSRRVALERAAGKVVSITISNSDGSRQTFRRSEPPLGM